ncbi:MAG TPA: general stress protein [Anaerolineales bacterium]
MTKAVYGIVRTHAEAASLIDKLRSAGFASTDVSILAPHNQQDQGLAVEKHTKSLEGTATGATAGGVLGGVLGLLAGIGTLAIPGLGILVAAGPLLATLSGMGLGASVGGLAGGLIGMGIPEYEAKLYERHLEQGGILVAVHCEESDAVSRAQDIMQAGATDIATGREKAA